MPLAPTTTTTNNPENDLTKNLSKLESDCILPKFRRNATTAADTENSNIINLDDVVLRSGATAKATNANSDLHSSCSTNSSGPSTSSNCSDQAKSQCSSLSDGEFFEGYGTDKFKPSIENVNYDNNEHKHDDNDVDVVDNNNTLNAGSTVGGGVELDLEPSNINAHSTLISEFDSFAIPRDWAHRSLRRPKNTSGRRQLGSNAQASQLYRSSSFHSSGQSSNGDTNDDMYSDISIDNVQDFRDQLELLQRQVTDLADNQLSNEDRTSRTKTEYAVLQARYHMLEEQLRESEMRADERIAEEQKRTRELLARVERETELQIENCQIKVKAIELEANTLREEAQRLRILCDKQEKNLCHTQENLELARDQIAVLQQDLEEAVQRQRQREKQKLATEDLMLELSNEVERLRKESGPAMPTTSPEAIRLEELHQELEEMRKKNRYLEEQNEELQAAVITHSVEEGRHLLNGTLNSLAQELQEMSQEQNSVDSATLASLSQLQRAYQDKEEENTRLKHYIDTILLNIVENYPQLLEVRPVTNNGNGRDGNANGNDHDDHNHPSAA